MKAAAARLIGLAAAAAAWTESAWWEGRWVDSSLSCDAKSGDQRPITLSWAAFRFAEAECTPVKEIAVASELRIRARCVSHGETSGRTLELKLRPSDGGGAMVLRMGGAEWHLRKCPPA